MITGLASKIIRPSYGGTREVNLPPGSSGLHYLDVVGGGDVHVLFTECRCEMDDSGTRLGGDVVGREDAMRVRVTDEEVERRGVVQTDQIRAGVLRAAPSVTHPARARSGRPDRVRAPRGRPAVVDLHVLDVRAYGHRQVGRERPRGGGPDQCVGAVERRSRRGQRHPDRDRGILTHLVRSRPGGSPDWTSGVCSYQLYGRTRKP